MGFFMFMIIEIFIYMIFRDFIRIIIVHYKYNYFKFAFIKTRIFASNK